MTHSHRDSIRRVAAALAAGVALSLAAAARPSSQGAAPGTYVVIGPDGNRRVLPFRFSANTDLIALSDVGNLFNLSMREDAAAGSVTITARGQRVLVTSGQALASVGGRVVSLSGQVVRDARGWYVPVDLLSRAIGPALNMRVDVRRASRLVVVGDARVPQVTIRVERQGASGRVTIDTQPATGHRVTREGPRLTVHFDADALDAGPPAGSAPEFATAVHPDGSTVIIDLGPLSASFRVGDDQDPSHFAIDLLPPAPPAPPAAPPPAPAPPRPAPVQEPPAGDLAAPGPVRTVVIDPGHGGDDTGVRGSGGGMEKDLTLQIARRLKASIEARIGLRVLLTRDGDDNIPVDKRTAFANNNQADLLLSLHANASLKPAARGAQVLSLSFDDYKRRADAFSTTGAQVPVVGGATRLIEAVPWDLAQIPYARKSAGLAALVVRHLGEQNVPLYKRAEDAAPLRILAGANMPAVLVEMGFLSNRDDERALASDEFAAAVVSALVSTVIDVRGGALAGMGAGPVRR